MSLFQRLFGESQGSLDTSKHASPQDIEHQMSPGLDGNYDAELREKAGMHQPPPPPEYMGIEGEYDVHGLAKRVAIAFDRDPELEDLETLQIDQDGSTVILSGRVPNRTILQHLTEVVRKVDGSKMIDTNQVMFE